MKILVTGATGTQGGAVARHLLGDGHEVRALVRDPSSPAAGDLEACGMVLAQGRFEDSRTLAAAMEGVQAVFSVQPAPQSDPDSERNEVRALAAAARQAGVVHFVHSSVSNTGDFRSMQGWREGRWSRNYWESKADAEAIVADAGFAQPTILRPAFMMENFAQPKASWMFPDLANGEILTAVEQDTRIALVAAEDIASAVSLAIANPQALPATQLELAGDWLSLPEIAEIMTRTGWGRVTARTATADELSARGQHDGWIETQEWLNVVGYPARPAQMTGLGLVPTTFAEWARLEKMPRDAP